MPKSISRRNFVKSTAAGGIGLSLLSTKEASAAPTNTARPNVLFIMVDQQRYDMIGKVQAQMPRYSGKVTIRTPNLDRLMAEGAYFKNAYTPCAVCAPARVTLRTGCTIERHGCQSNEAIREDVYNLMPDIFGAKVEANVTFDQLLVGNLGYVAEYYGKWHMPLRFYNKLGSTTPLYTYNHYDYATNTFKLSLTDSWANFHKSYLATFNAKGLISNTFPEGTQSCSTTKYAYYPFQLDARHGMATQTALTAPPFDAFDLVQEIGRDTLTASYTSSACCGDISVKALDRLCKQDKPFVLTASFTHPHVPMVACSKYLDYYWNNRGKLFVPPNVGDLMANSGYKTGQMIAAGYRIDDPAQLQEWTAVYYALIEEVDAWVGQLLAKLAQYPSVSANTLVVFISDHGEFLGAHGLREKNKFLEESARVPFILKFPGKIPAGTVVNENISTIDVFSTVLDYANASAYDASDGRSARRFIQKTNYNNSFDEEVIVTEWDYRYPTNSTTLARKLAEDPNFMVKKDDYKLMVPKLAASPLKDMLYNLSDDPYEVNNLIGDKGLTASNAVIGKAEHLKALLIEWMQRHDGGANRYFSDPKWNNYEGAGDLAEITKRRTWKLLNIWVSDTVIKFGSPVSVNGVLMRNEYLYFGRSASGSLTISSIVLEGGDAAKFSLSGFVSGTISAGGYKRVKITHRPTTASSTISDARVRIKHGAGADILVALTNR